MDIEIDGCTKTVFPGERYQIEIKSMRKHATGIIANISSSFPASIQFALDSPLDGQPSPVEIEIARKLKLPPDCFLSKTIFTLSALQLREKIVVFSSIVDQSILTYPPHALVLCDFMHCGCFKRRRDMLITCNNNSSLQAVQSTSQTSAFLSFDRGL